MKDGFMDEIRPSADLRKHYPELARFCKENKTPIAITVNGRSDTVLMSHRQFVEMRAQLNFYEHLAQSEEDIRLGRVSAAETVFDRLKHDLTEGANEI